MMSRSTTSSYVLLVMLYYLLCYIDNHVAEAFSITQLRKNQKHHHRHHHVNFVTTPKSSSRSIANSERWMMTKSSSNDDDDGIAAAENNNNNNDIDDILTNFPNMINERKGGEDDDSSSSSSSLKCVDEKNKLFLSLLNDEIPDGINRNNTTTITNQSNTNKSSNFPLAPPLTYQKWLTMQEKRVVVTIRYTDRIGMKPYFLTLAQKLKLAHPDIIIQNRPYNSATNGASISGDDYDNYADGNGKSIGGQNNNNNAVSNNNNNNNDDENGNTIQMFEVLVDDKVILGRNGIKNPKNTNDNASVFISMNELSAAIERARRRRRPTTTVYGSEEQDEQEQRRRYIVDLD